MFGYDGSQLPCHFFQSSIETSAERQASILPLQQEFQTDTEDFNYFTGLHQQKKRLLQMDRHCIRTQEIRLEHPVRPARPQMAPAQWLHPSPLGAIQPASYPPRTPGWSISLPNLPKKPRVSDPEGSGLWNSPCP